MFLKKVQDSRYFAEIDIDSYGTCVLTLSVFSRDTLLSGARAFFKPKNGAVFNTLFRGAH